MCFNEFLRGRGEFQGKVKQAVSLIDTGTQNRTVELLYIFALFFVIEYVLGQITICFSMYSIAVSYKLTLD